MSAPSRRLDTGWRESADPAAAAYLVAVLLAVAQVVLLDEPGRTARAAVPYVLAFVVVVALRHLGPRDEAAMARWVHALSVFGVLLSMWLLGAFLGALPAGIGEQSGFYRVKLAVTSPLGDHNTAAGLMLPAVVACAATAVRDPRWRAGLVVVTLGLAATLSRGAVLVLLGLALVGWLVASDRRFRTLLLASAAAATALVLLLAVVLDASPPADAEVPRDGPVGASVVGRVNLAERGLRVGSERPLLGTGLGGFGQRADDLPPPNDHAHQLFAHAFAEGGVPLFLVAVAVPALLAVRVVRLAPGAGREILLLGGLGLLVHAQIEILGGRLGYEVLLALLVGLAGTLPRAEGRGSEG